LLKQGNRGCRYAHNGLPGQINKQQEIAMEKSLIAMAMLGMMMQQMMEHLSAEPGHQGQ
jgi:hypothetical protein